jgi:hypothetical protein
MKNIIFITLTVAVVIVIAGQFKKMEKRQEAFEQEVDDVIRDVLDNCLEAYCEDCDQILAQGTGSYKDTVTSVAYTHREVYDHEVKVKSWAEL